MVGPSCRCVEAFVTVAAVVVECSCSDIDLVGARSLVVVANEVDAGAGWQVELLDMPRAVVEVRNKEMGGSTELGLGLSMDPDMVVAGLYSEMEAPVLWSGLVRRATEYMVKLVHCVDLEIRVGA